MIVLAVPLVTRSLVHCNSVTGETIDCTAVLVCNSCSTRTSCSTLSGVNRSATVLPSATVNSTTMLSPPNSCW
jgi:hypothetical protein